MINAQNILKTALLLTHDLTSDVPGKRQYRYITSNDDILKLTGCDKYVGRFNSFELKPGQFPVFDIFNEKFFVIENDDILQNVSYPGLPYIFNPGFLGNPNFNSVSDQVNRKYIELMYPFCALVKEIKTRNINDIGLIDDYYLELGYMKNLLQELAELDVFVDEDFIPGGLGLIASSKKLTSDFYEKYTPVKYISTINYIANETNNKDILEIPIVEYINKLKNDIEFKDKIKGIYIDFLNLKKQFYISDLQQKLDKIETTLSSLSSVSDTEFVNNRELKNQITTVLDKYNNFDFNQIFKKVDNINILLRLYPFNDSPPDEISKNYNTFSNFEAKIVLSLYENDLNFILNDFDKFKVKLPFWAFVKENNEDNYASNCLSSVKQKRLQQIEDNKQKLINEIKDDILKCSDENEKKDLQEIIDLLNADKSYITEIEGITDISQALTYWPTILYPCPNFVLSFNE